MAGGSKRTDGKQLKKAGAPVARSGAGPRDTAAVGQGRKRLRSDPGMSGTSVAAGRRRERRLARERPMPLEEAEADQEALKEAGTPGHSVEGADEEPGPGEDRPGTSEAGPSTEQWQTPLTEGFGGEGLFGDPDTLNCNEDPFLSDVHASPVAQGVGGTLLRFGPAFGDPEPPVQPESPHTAQVAICGGASVSTRRVRRRLGAAVSGSSGAIAQGARGGNKGGKKEGRKGGRPPSATPAGLAPRWCKPLYVHDPDKEGALLRGSARTGLQADHHKIICRLCGHMISFAASSFTSAARHAGVHGVTHDNLDVAVALANTADDNGEDFPLKRWLNQLASAEGTRKVSTYMRQDPYDTGSQMWQDIRASIARWIAADTLPMTVVESAAFRAFCRSLNGRCPGFSRKTISRKVSSLPASAEQLCCVACGHSWLPFLGVVCC